MDKSASVSPPAYGFRAQNSHVHSSSDPPPVQYGPVQSQQTADGATTPVAPDAPRDAAHAPSTAPSTTPAPSSAAPSTSGAAAAPTAARDSTRTRHSSACFPCARRKVKCDRDVKNPCSNCLRRSQPDQCQVKSQRDKLSHSRSDNNLRDGEAHRDKRPRYEAYQTSFHATPAPKAELSPRASESTLMSSVAAYAAHSPEDRGAPAAAANTNNGPPYQAPSAPAVATTAPPKRSPPPTNSKKSREPSHWDSIEALLPPRKDFIKYISIYRIGPHIVNPVINNIDAFESQVCTLLEEIGTPKIRQRLAGKDRRTSEVELGRLARVLAVLASGSRYEDSNYAIQVTVSRDYIRRAFSCLRLANYILRPTIECIQTLILLTTELQNDHQPDTAWALLGTTARLAHSVGINFRDYPTLPPEHDYAIARSSIAWQDMMHSLWRKDPAASLAMAYPTLGKHDDDKQTYLGALCDVYRSAVAVLEKDVSPMGMSASVNTELTAHVDYMRSVCRAYPNRECKSVRDRCEVASFRVHGGFLLASVLLKLGEAKHTHHPSESLELDEQAKAALLEVLSAYLDFGNISNLPTRTYILTHYALTSALELCRWQQAPDGLFQGTLLPKMLNSLDSLADAAQNGHSGSAYEDERLLSEQHLRAMDLLSDIFSDSRQVYADRNREREIPESLRADAGQLLQQMDKLRDPVDGANGVTIPLQSAWGL